MASVTDLCIQPDGCYTVSACCPRLHTHTSERLSALYKSMHSTSPNTARDCTQAAHERGHGVQMAACGGLHLQMYLGSLRQFARGYWIEYYAPFEDRLNGSFVEFTDNSAVGGAGGAVYQQNIGNLRVLVGAAETCPQIMQPVVSSFTACTF